MNYCVEGLVAEEQIADDTDMVPGWYVTAGDSDTRAVMGMCMGVGVGVGVGMGMGMGRS